MLVSTPDTYLMHCPQCMQVKGMHEIGKEKMSPPPSARTSDGARSDEPKKVVARVRPQLISQVGAKYCGRYPCVSNGP